MSTGEHYNPFFEDFNSINHDIQISGRVEIGPYEFSRRVPVHTLAKYINSNRNGQITLSPELHRFLDPLLLLDTCVNALSESTMLLREMIYEKVRASEFSSKPSRQTGLWLTNDSDDATDYWRGSLSGENMQVYRVEVEGNLHFAHDHRTATTTGSLAVIEERAREYWSNNDDRASIETEILMEGQLRVIEIIPSDS